MSRTCRQHVRADLCSLGKVPVSTSVLSADDLADLKPNPGKLVMDCKRPVGVESASPLFPSLAADSIDHCCWFKMAYSCNEALQRSKERIQGLICLIPSSYFRYIAIDEAGKSIGHQQLKSRSGVISKEQDHRLGLPVSAV